MTDSPVPALSALYRGEDGLLVADVLRALLRDHAGAVASSDESETFVLAVAEHGLAGLLFEPAGTSLAPELRIWLTLVHEAARHATSDRFFDGSARLVPPLAMWRSPAATRVRALVGEGAPLVVGLAPVSTLHATAGESGAWSVSGSCVVRLAPDAQDAVVLVPDPEGDGHEAVLVSLRGDGVTVRPDARFGEPHAGVLELDGAQIGPAARLGGLSWVADPGEPADRARAAALAELGVCVELHGCALEAFTRTDAYVRVREQFGRPIGAFQAVQHRLADMRLMLRSIDYLVQDLFRAVAEGGDIRVAVATTKVACAEAASAVVEGAIQLHGGIGFTEEAGLHLLLRRVAAARAAFGDPSEYRVGLGRLEIERVAGAGGVTSWSG